MGLKHNLYKTNHESFVNVILQNLSAAISNKVGQRFLYKTQTFVPPSDSASDEIGYKLAMQLKELLFENFLNGCYSGYIGVIDYLPHIDFIYQWNLFPAAQRDAIWRFSSWLSQPEVLMSGFYQDHKSKWYYNSMTTDRAKIGQFYYQ